MVDTLPPDKRSWVMSRVHAKNTAPEMRIRRLLWKLGYRFRIHAKTLPGKPDVVFIRRRKVIFVHGCFWHGHEGCPRARIPKTNTAYWREKIERNKSRDRQILATLGKAGWGTLVLWECQINSPNLSDVLTTYLGPRNSSRQTNNKS